MARFLSDNILNLMQLGLTELESEIYVYLLDNSPATGYRIATSIGKPTANTYKAIDRLFDKGAITVADGDRRMCRAIPVKEFLRILQRQFEKASQETKSALANREPNLDCDYVYRLKTVDQVYERFRQLLRETKSLAVLDLFPDAAIELKDDIESATERGVKIAVKLYQPLDLSAEVVVITRDGQAVLDGWPGIWGNGVFDANRYLLSLTSRDQRHVHYAIWSTNLYASCVYHSALVQELTLAELDISVLSKNSNAARIAEFCSLLRSGCSPLKGYETLLSQLLAYEKASSSLSPPLRT